MSQSIKMRNFKLRRAACREWERRCEVCLENKYWTKDKQGNICKTIKCVSGSRRLMFCGYWGWSCGFAAVLRWKIFAIKLPPDQHLLQAHKHKHKWSLSLSWNCQRVSCEMCLYFKRRISRWPCQNQYLRKTNTMINMWECWTVLSIKQPQPAILTNCGH